MNTTLQLKKTLANLFQKTTFNFGILFLGFYLFTSLSALAQVVNYGYQEFNGVSHGEVYTPIAGTDIFGSTPFNQFTPIGSEIPIGFSFNYNGTNYSQVKVHSNGFIYFGGSSNVVAAQATPINNASITQYAGAVAGHSRGLVYSSFGSAPIYSAVTHPTSVEYLMTGAVGSRVFTVQFKNMARPNGSLAAREGLLNFQIKLHEGTNVVEVIYDQQVSSPSTNVQLPGQCGLRGAAATDYSNRVANSVDYLVTTPGGANNVGINYRNTSNAGTVIRMQWTPPCYTPSGLTAINFTGTTADISWTAPTVAPTSYQFEVRSSGLAGSGPVGLGDSGTVAGISTVANGLSEGFTYTLYVRSFCGGSDYSAWVTGPTFTLPCVATTVPYYLPFDPMSDGFTIGNMPVCTSNQNGGGGGNNWLSTNPNFGAGYFDEHLTYSAHPTNPANTWFITKGIALTAGETYRIQYLYGGSSNFTFYTNKMEVRYGTTGTAAGLAGAIQIENHPEIKSSPETNIVNFTAPTTDTYYFGFRAYSDANMANLYLDDIFIDVSNCLKPTGLIAPAVLVSFNNATITWTAPTPSPANGYAYYYNTTGVAPTNGTPFSGTVPAGTTLTTIPSLTPNTLYYVWVRSICGPSEFGEWSAGTSFTTLPAPPVYCIPSGAGYFQDPNGITNVTMGSINNTTGLELPNYYGNYSGLTTNVAQGATVPVSITFRTGFTYDTIIWVDWNNDGDFVDAGEQVYSGVSGFTNPTTLLASFTVPGAQPLGPRRLRIGSIDAPTFVGGALTSCRNGEYQAFEDYTINVIFPPPALTLSASTMSAQCGLTNSPLITITSPLANYDVYTWTPSAGVSGTPGTGFTFNTSATTTYILTASQTSGSFSTNTATFTYVANETPTPITIATPNGTASCVNGPAIQLNAAGGIVSNVTVFSENFNSGINGPPDLVPVPPVLQFKSRISSTGGSSPAASAWTIRPSGYTTTGPVWFDTFSSNDNTNFVFANSDSQGDLPAPSVTRSRLISPPINLTSYTSATLNFYHYFRYLGINDLAYVQVAIDNANLATFPEGTDPESPSLTWTNLAQYTSNQGTATNFAQTFLNLNPYAGQVIRIRFNYQSNWGWGWAVDNFRVLGSASSDIVWSPTTGLYTDAAGTIPYTGTATNVVYAMPATDQVYTAAATAPGPTFCQSTQTVAITVTPQVGGTLSANQVSCDTASFNNITLTGHTGNIIRWEYANDAAFTVGVTTIANTTTTLTPAQFGTFTTVRYFRAVVGTGVCNPVYSTITSVTINSTTLTGTNTWSNGTPDITKRVIIAGNYTASSNFSACSVQVLSGATLLVQSGVTVIVENEFVVDGPSLPTTVIFQNNSSLVQLSDAVNSGSIRYERNTTPVVFYDYTYWSSPVANQTLGTFSPDTAANRFYVFNNTTYSWQNISTASVMNAAKGYIIRAPGTHSTTVPSVFTGSFYGVPHNGPYSIGIVVSGTQNRNLLGNPYPSAIDADLLYAANNTVLQGNMFFWTHNTPITANNYNSNDYAVYNASGGAGTAASPNPGVNPNVPNGNIAAGQGFFVQGLASGTVNFDNTIRLSGSNNLFYRSANAQQLKSLEKHRIWLNIINQQGAYKQMLLGYIEGATNELDNAYDAELTEAGNVVSLYSLNSDKKLTIQGRTLPFNVNDEVPLGFRTSVPGAYSIELENFDGLFEEGQIVYLEDKWLNVIHNLNESNYNFTTETGTFEDRFEVQFTNGTLGVTNPTDASNAIVVYKNSETIFINSSNLMMAEVKLFDIRGRLITAKQDILATEVSFANLNIANQMILVQITTTDGVILTKKVAY
ncbi:GEVED domain-containing protein [Flavobacterium azooxidireducens]|uniref:GEVED domain-containing protein n=1 Tax=Flavobacterium azooxidireducens TaxID=1871076 RepID=A0ABY4KIY6_9FLAO|nr:GEVED domain-containing protein [Flavobacterium azooxidireducens]UPQ80772.1 GEVED domain-containing protein [Flavobacterium azooxidireducens]